MKKLTLLLSLLLLVPIHAEEQSKLGAHMDELSSLLKSTRRVDSWAEKADLARKAQDELLACFSLVPMMVEGVEDTAQKEKMVADYKRLLALNYAKLCELELAYLEEDEDLVDDIKDQLKGIKKEGHTEYIEKD